jgi:hypothetical protein
MVQKLEGFRLGLQVKRSHFRISEALTLDLRKLAFECPARQGGDEKCVLPEAARIR